MPFHRMCQWWTGFDSWTIVLNGFLGTFTGWVIFLDRFSQIMGLEFSFEIINWIIKNSWIKIRNKKVLAAFGSSLPWPASNFSMCFHRTIILTSKPFHRHPKQLCSCTASANSYLTNDKFIVGKTNHAVFKIGSNRILVIKKLDRSDQWICECITGI